MTNFETKPCEDYHKTEKTILSRMSEKAISTSLINNSNVNDDLKDIEVIEEFSDFPTLISIPNKIYTVAVSPSYQKEIVIGRKPSSLEGPLLFAALVVACNLIIYTGIAITNKIKTGRFFLKKHLSEIDILVGYKKKEFQFSQAVALLENIHNFPTEKAVCFLLDTFPDFENDFKKDSFSQEKM